MIDGIKRRRLTAKEQQARKKYVRINTFGDYEFHVLLTVDHQSFTVLACTNSYRANWHGDMLAIALARMIEAEKVKP